MPPARRCPPTPPGDEETISTAAPPAITVTGLRKSFGEHVVLDGIDLTIPAGTIFALLGPNGARPPPCRSCPP